MKKVFLVTALFFGGVTLMSAQTQLQNANQKQTETTVKKAPDQNKIEKAELRAKKDEIKNVEATDSKKAQLEKVEAVRRAESLKEAEKKKEDALQQKKE